MKILGTPGHKDWPEFFVHTSNMNVKFPEEIKKDPRKLNKIIPTASNEAIDLL